MSLVNPLISIEADIDDDTISQEIYIVWEWRVKDEEKEQDIFNKLRLLREIKKEIDFQIKTFDDEGNLFAESNIIRKY